MTKTPSPLPTPDADFFRRLTLSICSSLDLQKALERCLVTLRDQMPAEDIFLILDAPWLGGFHVMAQATIPGLPKLNKDIPLPPEILETVAEHPFQQPIIVNDTSKHPNCIAVATYVKNQGFSEILIPINIKGEKKGSLVIRARGNDRYTREHLQLISRVYAPFAMAVANGIQHMELLSLKERLRDENRYLKSELYPRNGEIIIGENGGLSDVMKAVRQVAPLNSTALLLGETGVGKEIIARAIHRGSSRSSGPFIGVNCGAIPETLIDSELFGHVKGAFSGATDRHVGRFERADGGTLFLDEIGELPIQVQARLLRAIQTREIEPVGGSGPVPVNIRIIAATHRNLKQMVQEGSFREDLWFRLNPFPIHIPPLRERPQDIVELTRYFIDKKQKELGLGLSHQVDWSDLEQLRSLPWPGNVRELENYVEQRLIRSRGKMVRFSPPQTDLKIASSLSEKNSAAVSPQEIGPAERTLEATLSSHIRKALERTGGKVHGPDGAAALLDIHPSTLRHRMRKMGIAHGRSY